jgi:hypothetical protein
MVDLTIPKWTSCIALIDSLISEIAHPFQLLITQNDNFHHMIIVRLVDNLSELGPTFIWFQSCGQSCTAENYCVGLWLECTAANRSNHAAGWRDAISKHRFTTKLYILWDKNCDRLHWTDICEYIYRIFYDSLIVPHSCLGTT